jgi:hypothetical protein
LLTCCCAASTASCASVLSMRASTCPAVTWSPTLTSSSVTTALVVKLNPRVWTMVTVPAAEAVTVTIPLVAGAVVEAAATVACPRRSARLAVTATANATAATTTNVGPRRRNVMVRQSAPFFS